MKHTRERVASDLRQRLSEIFSLRVSDPRLRDVMIVEVRPSADLSFARVFYRVLGGDADLSGALERAKPFVRRSLAQGLRMRRVPELAFVHDESPDRAERIEALLRETGSGIGPDADAANGGGEGPA